MVLVREVCLRRPETSQMGCLSLCPWVLFFSQEEVVLLSYGNLAFVWGKIVLGFGNLAYGSKKQKDSDSTPIV
jgi:hypothetical protein